MTMQRRTEPGRRRRLAIRWAAGLMFLGPGPALGADPGGFEAYVEDQEAAVEAYRAQEQAAFAAYRKAHAEAFAAYRARIQAHWDRVEVTQARQWVEYQENDRVKRVVDFAANEIRLSFQIPDEVAVSHRGGGWARLASDSTDPASVRRRATAAVTELLATRVGEAVARDPVVQGVAARVASGASSGPAALEGGGPRVLAELVPASNADGERLRQTAQRLVADAKISVRVAKTHQGGGGNARSVRAHVVRIALPSDRPLKKAAAYVDSVQAATRQWRLSESDRLNTALLLAVIHTESVFNPLAQSPEPAYGLMLIAPAPEDRERQRLLQAQRDVSQPLSPNYLFRPENNIRLGTQALHRYYQETFAGVESTRSRIYCALAAYARDSAFVFATLAPDHPEAGAIQRINQQSERRVLTRLDDGLAERVEQRYVDRVLSRIGQYEGLLARLEDPGGPAEGVPGRRLAEALRPGSSIELQTARPAEPDGSDELGT